MRRWLWLAAALLASPLGCNKPVSDQSGSGVQRSETRKVPEFRRLKAGGRANVSVEVGSTCDAEITTDDNLLTAVGLQLEGDILRVSTGAEMKPKVPVRVQLCTTALDGVVADGIATLDAKGLKAERLVVKAAGGARLTLRGSAAHAEVTLKGGGVAELSELALAEAHAQVDAGRLRLGHVEKLDITITGPGVVSYRGQPELKQSVSKLGRLLQER